MNTPRDPPLQRGRDTGRTLSRTPVGKSIHFRLVEVSDSEFIVKLRSTNERSQHLSEVTPDIEAQRIWIINYKGREQAGLEFYFVIELKSGDPIGLVRLYDFQGHSFCWGSWIIKPGSPQACGIESALLVYETAFNDLGFSASHFEVRKENQRVWAFHERMGAKRVNESDLDFHYVMSVDDYQAAKLRFSRFLIDA